MAETNRGYVATAWVSHMHSHQSMNKVQHHTPCLECPQQCFLAVPLAVPLISAPSSASPP